MLKAIEKYHPQAGIDFFPIAIPVMVEIIETYFRCIGWANVLIKSCSLLT